MDMDMIAKACSVSDDLNVSLLPIHDLTHGGLAKDALLLCRAQFVCRVLFRPLFVFIHKLVAKAMIDLFKLFTEL